MCFSAVDFYNKNQINFKLFFSHKNFSSAVFPFRFRRKQRHGIIALFIYRKISSFLNYAVYLPFHKPPLLGQACGQCHLVNTNQEGFFEIFFIKELVTNLLGFT